MSDSIHTFEFSERLSQASSLRSRLINILGKSDDEKVRALVADVPALQETKAILTVAFVGQYNAGKSTIISALTGQEDVPIDADVCTDKVTAYDWNDICLLDTPGIHAGNQDHDDDTYQTIDRAHLLVFVITSELFDDVIGRHFRALMFDRKKADETLLVVNKMGQSPGSDEIMRPDLEEVTKPFFLEDFRTTFIDALSFIEAQNETDPADRTQLLEIGAFDDFVAALNSFVDDRGLMGKISTPLFGIRTVASEGRALLAVDRPEDRAALELLYRKRGAYNSSRTRLRDSLKGLVAAATSDIVLYGDEVAESIKPKAKEASLNDHHEKNQHRAGKRWSQLEEEVSAVVERELNDLHRQLEALENSPLARKLTDFQSNTAQTGSAQSCDDEAQKQGLKFERQVPTQVESSKLPSNVNKISKVGNTIAKSVTSWTTGTAKGAKIGSAKAASGSNAHKTILLVGKYFGVKFKPWGAVNVAKTMGNAARVMGVAAAVLAVVGQVTEDIQQEKDRKQISELRDCIRVNYRKSARTCEEDFWSRLDKFDEEVYGKEIASLDETVSQFIGQRTARTSTEDALRTLEAEVGRVIDAIHSQKL
ncbi:MAG: 50S ribosome-binding GTPase [Aestuariivita sp.]|nr:50S ribosome-binding GTPase [Aestuariivita sp.]MCY4345849.1 50S ribosome-binding GTPase [Aestuariivita sp.]